VKAVGSVDAAVMGSCPTIGRHRSRESGRNDRVVVRWIYASSSSSSGTRYHLLVVAVLVVELLVV